MLHLPEIEAKILDTTEAELLPRLTELGFQPYFEGILQAQWLINPTNGEKLRVRQENDIVMIEHKESLGGMDAQMKSNQETGFEARDFEAAIATLEKVGLQKVGPLSVKRRVSYIRDADSDKQVRLDFDTYSELRGKSIPEFLEIEATMRRMCMKQPKLSDFSVQIVGTLDRENFLSIIIRVRRLYKKS